MQCGWTLMLIRTNHLSNGVNCLLGKRIASYEFYLGRTCILITRKFINEVVNC